MSSAASRCNFAAIRDWSMGMVTAPMGGNKLNPTVDMTAVDVLLHAKFIRLVCILIAGVRLSLRRNPTPRSASGDESGPLPATYDNFVSVHFALDPSAASTAGGATEMQTVRFIMDEEEV